MLQFLLSGGIYHDFDASSALIAREFRKLGLETVVFDEPEAALSALATSPRCDLLTISPALLLELQQSEAPVVPVLTPAYAQAQQAEPLILEEPSFRFRMNQDAMATEKLAEGIRQFAADAQKLETLLEARRGRP